MKYDSRGRQKIIFLAACLLLLLMAWPVIAAETAGEITSTGAEVSTDENTGETEPAPEKVPIEFIQGNFFSSRLSLGVLMPLGAAAAALNPWLSALADFGYNFNASKGSLGVMLSFGLAITDNQGKEIEEYVLQSIPVALKIKLSTKPDCFRIGIPLQIYLEGGGGIAVNMIHFVDENLNPPDSSFWPNMTPLALWDLGINYYFTRWFSVSLCNTAVLIFFDDLLHFGYNPNIRVDFYF